MNDLKVGTSLCFRKAYAFTNNAKDLSLEDVEKAVKHITEVITGFLCSVEQVFPKQVYGDFAKDVSDLNQISSKPQQAQIHWNFQS